MKWSHVHISTCCHDRWPTLSHPLWASYLPLSSLFFSLSKYTDNSTSSQSCTIHGTYLAQRLIHHRLSVNMNVSPFIIRTNMNHTVICLGDRYVGEFLLLCHFFC